VSLTMKDTGGSFTPCPAGNHVAVCYAVLDLGTQHSDAFTWEGKSIPESTRPQVMLMWEIPAETVEVDGEKKPAVISKFYNAFFNDKATLRQHLESWRGRQFTEEELCGFNIMNVLGKGCMINVVHDAKGKAKITSVSALPKGMVAPKPTNPLVTIDMDDFNQVSFDSLSEGIQNIIKKSPEWQALNQPAQGFRDKTPDNEPPDFGDDDIPF
jgi:hypothetical protein